MLIPRQRNRHAVPLAFDLETLRREQAAVTSAPAPAEPGLARHRDPRFNLPTVRLLPGDCHASGANILITTTLGSCIAACLWDDQRKVGGMNHFMLPESPAGGADLLGEAGRYGVHAMELLINELLKLGAQKTRLKAKVFGGGAVLPGLNLANVGQRNADFVTRFLSIERIPIIASDLLDIWPRRVNLFPASGRALVRKLRDGGEDSLAESEKTYRRNIAQAPIAAGGGVELF